RKPCTQPRRLADEPCRPAVVAALDAVLDRGEALLGAVLRAGRNDRYASEFAHVMRGMRLKDRRPVSHGFEGACTARAEGGHDEGSGSRGGYPPQLPHHRTYGSVCGGSDRARKSTVLIEEAHEPLTAEHTSRQCRVHMAGARVPPRTVAIGGRHAGASLGEPQLVQLPSPRTRTLPLPPEQRSQLAPQPTIQLLEVAFHLAQSEVRHPAPDERSECSDDTAQ